MWEACTGSFTLRGQPRTKCCKWPPAWPRVPRPACRLRPPATQHKRGGGAGLTSSTLTLEWGAVSAYTLRMATSWLMLLPRRVVKVAPRLHSRSTLLCAGRPTTAVAMASSSRCCGAATRAQRSGGASKSGVQLVPEETEEARHRVAPCARAAADRGLATPPHLVIVHAVDLAVGPLGEELEVVVGAPAGGTCMWERHAQRQSTLPRSSGAASTTPAVMQGTGHGCSGTRMHLSMPRCASITTQVMGPSGLTSCT